MTQPTKKARPRFALVTGPEEAPNAKEFLVSMLPRSDRNVNPDNGYRPLSPARDVRPHLAFQQDSRTMTDAEFAEWAAREADVGTLRPLGINPINSNVRKTTDSNGKETTVKVGGRGRKPKSQPEPKQEVPAVVEAEQRPSYDFSYYPDIEEERDARDLFDAEPCDDEPDYDRLAGDSLDAAIVEPGEGWHSNEVIEAIGAVESRKRGRP